MKKFIFFLFLLILIPYTLADSIANDSTSVIVPIGEYCGDDSCNNNETCSSCSEDCGNCPSNGGGGGSHSTTNITISTPCTGKITNCPTWPECQSGEKRQYRTCTTDCNATFEDFRDCPAEGEIITEPVVTPPTEPEVIYPPEEKQWQWWEIVPWTAIKEVSYAIIIVVLILLILILFYRYFKKRKQEKINETEKLPRIPPWWMDERHIQMPNYRPMERPIQKPCFIPPEERTFLDEQPEHKTLDEFDGFIEKQNRKLDEVLTKSKKHYEKLNSVDKTVSKLSFNLSNAKKRFKKAKDNLNRKF